MSTVQWTQGDHVRNHVIRVRRKTCGGTFSCITVKRITISLSGLRAAIVVQYCSVRRASEVMYVCNASCVVYCNCTETRWYINFKPMYQGSLFVGMLGHVVGEIYLIKVRVHFLSWQLPSCQSILFFVFLSSPIQFRYCSHALIDNRTSPSDLSPLL